MPDKIIIPWDLGATKCAAAVVRYETKSHQLECLERYSVKLKSCHSFADLVDQIETGLHVKMSDAEAIVIGAAGQYDGREIRLESAYPFPMNVAEIANQQNWPRFSVVHDYTPIVCATFTSYMDNLDNIKTLHRGIIQPYGRHVAIGIGTGLGVKDGVLFENGNFWLGTNEMGHIGISYPPKADYYYLQRHRELIGYLRHEMRGQLAEPITFEKILSGSGLTRLHNFIYKENKITDPGEVGRLCQEGKAEETIAIFAWYIGLFVGTVELTFMPSGGTWITGGVVLKNLNVFNHPEFYRGIQASPAYRLERSNFPLGVLVNPDHAFLGGAYYATQRII